MPRAKDCVQILPITGEEIVDFFSSKSFLDALDRTANYTYATGYESGFLAERGIDDNRTKITEIVFSRPESLTFSYREGVQDVRRKHLYPGRQHREVAGETPGHYPFFKFHFHPEARGPPCPSEKDLLAADGVRPLYAKVSKWDVRPIEGVGIVDNQREIEMVLYQKSIRGELPREDIQELYEQIQAISVDAVVKCLRDSGYYKAEFTRYMKNGTDYVPCQDALKRLAIFAYNPAIQIESWVMKCRIRQA